MSGSIKGVLFDLDGTLLDTAQDFFDALNKLRAEEHLPPLLFEQVRCQVSHGGHALVRLGFGTLDPDAHEAMRMRLLTIYRGQLAKHTRLFEGGDEMLRDLERRGLAWGNRHQQAGLADRPAADRAGPDRTCQRRGQRRHTGGAQAAPRSVAACGRGDGRGAR